MESEKPVKVIEFEDFNEEIARLSSLKSALIESQQKKNSLQHNLQSLIKVRGESLIRVNELDEMRRKMEVRKLVMGKLRMRSKVAAEEVKRRVGELSVAVELLLVSAKALMASSKQLQEAVALLGGEIGQPHLNKLQKRLHVRIRHMVAQVSALYPVKSTIGQRNDESLCVGSISGLPSADEPLNTRSLAIIGLQLSALPLKNSFFNDKKAVQSSASALGYVAHAVSLIASYLDVPLRYHVHLGGSRSYIRDYAPSTFPYSDSSSNSLSVTNSKPIDFPLFLEGQDTTRASYAIFLLNKDLEQLLNFIGVESLGPRHILANLKELYRSIQSCE